jgi:hypothetical protein
MPEYPTVLRLYLPLLEPDVRICRIRLSDQSFNSVLSPTEGGG